MKSTTANFLPVLQAWCKANGFEPPVPEFKFDPNRRWRFDFAWPFLWVAFEREGATWTGGRHARGKGYRDDCIKYSMAAADGWCVIRATADMIKDGTAFAILEDALGKRLEIFGGENGTTIY